MNSYENTMDKLQQNPSRWLITGVAGFIGLNLLQKLLDYGQQVVGLDNFLTGSRANLDAVLKCQSPDALARFKMIEGDICNLEDCLQATHQIDYVLHQAALGSVPRSIEMPLNTHAHNVNGFLNMLIAAKENHTRRFIYASSSSVYGDTPIMPRQEGNAVKPLSPYAVSKYTDELYAAAWARCYNLEVIGLRYFNVFGPYQGYDNPYAAVIPIWISSLIQGKQIFINGDGQTSRDFCYVDNVVQANILAALATSKDAVNQVYNIAVGQKITLNELYEAIRGRINIDDQKIPQYREFRQGDVPHSLADISKAHKLLGYSPQYTLHEGLDQALPWYKTQIQ